MAQTGRRVKTRAALPRAFFVIPQEIPAEQAALKNVSGLERKRQLADYAEESKYRKIKNGIGFMLERAAPAADTAAAPRVTDYGLSIEKRAALPVFGNRAGRRKACGNRHF